MLSIVIPTLNEEKYLPLLLESIKKQDFLDYEIIIADAGSKDSTLQIAKKYNCEITTGGLPAKGRNEGAKVAKGDFLFFLDADTILPDNFLAKWLEEFGLRKLDIASFCFDTQDKKKGFQMMIDFYNEIAILLEETRPFSIIGVLVKKEVFEKLKGYDETIKLSEDTDLGRRAIKFAQFGILRAGKIFISDRRFVKDGWMTTTTKYILSELHTLFIGPIKSDIFNYKFDHYDDKK